MKYLLFTLEYPPFKGGVAKYYESVIKYWPGKENNPIFVLSNENKKLVHPIFSWLPAIWQLYKNCKHNKIDHIFVGQILPLGTTTLIISKIFNKPYSVFLHGMDLTFALKTSRKKFLTNLILKNSQQIICGNHYVEQMIVGLDNKYKHKIIIANPGTDELSFNEKIADDIQVKYNTQDKLVVFSMGRLVKRKGFDILIETLPRVTNEFNNVLYVIAGGGPDDKYLHEKAEALGVIAKDRILFAGKITDDEYHAWLSLCDIFAMPSRNINGDFEGFGIVYLEANSMGKPVVAGASGGVSDAVENGVNGLLVNPENKDDVANAIISLLKDKDLRQKLGEAGKQRAKNDFNWPKQVLNIYNSLK